MPYRVDARLTGRHPFELYLLYLTFLTALPTLLGIAPRPGSITHAMPEWLAFSWSLTLTGGAGIALAGIYWFRRDLGLIMEQLGLALTSISCLVYAAVLLSQTGISSLFPFAILAGYGVSCLVRVRHIQRFFNRAVLVQEQNKGLDR